jgi:hypothetical protein
MKIIQADITTLEVDDKPKKLFYTFCQICYNQ